jgi:hypothetical protein
MYQREPDSPSTLYPAPCCSPLNCNPSKIRRRFFQWGSLCCSPYVKDQFLDLGTIMKSFLRSVKTFRTPDLVYLVPIIWLDCVHKYNHCIRRVVVPWQMGVVALNACSNPCCSSLKKHRRQMGGAVPKLVLITWCSSPSIIRIRNIIYLSRKK